MIYELDMEEELDLLELQGKNHFGYYMKSGMLLSYKFKSYQESILLLGNRLFEEFSLEGKLPLEKQKAIHCVLCNLLICKKLRIPLVISKDKTYYSGFASRYRPKFFTYANVVPVLNKFIELGYVAEYKGGKFPSGKSFRGRIDSTDKLLELVNNYSLNDFEEEEHEELIELRGYKNADGKAPLINYEDDEITIAMRTKIGNYNAYMSHQEVTLQLKEETYSNIDIKKKISLYNYFSKERFVHYKDVEHINQEDLELINNFIPYTQTFSLPNTNVRRIFNNESFEEGGRCYGGDVQSLPKKVRTDVLINGHFIVEPDYSALHIRMFYHKEGIDLPSNSDPYTFGEPNTRKLNKKVANIMFNSDDEVAAIKAIATDFGSDDDLKEEYGNEVSTHDYIRTLIQAFRTAHPRISQYIFSGEGLRLQKTDSDIMVEILDELVDRDIPAIPIHDSVMVEKSHKDEVIELMITKYREKMSFDAVVSCD